MIVKVGSKSPIMIHYLGTFLHRATLLSPEDELARVLPVISALKGSEATRSALLSIDTFYGQVAAATVKAGVHIVNDVSAGTLDESMLPTVSAMAPHVPYTMMHMRGNPQTMQSDQHLTYTNGVVEDAAVEVNFSLFYFTVH